MRNFLQQSALALGGALVLLIGSWGGPVEAASDYRVTSYGSHIAMCSSDFVADDYKDQCIVDAMNAWL